MKKRSSLRGTPLQHRSAAARAAEAATEALYQAEGMGCSDRRTAKLTEAVFLSGQADAHARFDKRGSHAAAEQARKVSNAARRMFNTCSR